MFGLCSSSGNCSLGVFYFTKHVSQSTFVHIESTVNIQIIRRLLQCYNVIVSLKNTFKNFYLTIFMAINTNIMNKTNKTFYINY